jgi:hypothetical protein
LSEGNLSGINVGMNSSLGSGRLFQKQLSLISTFVPSGGAKNNFSYLGLGLGKAMNSRSMDAGLFLGPTINFKRTTESRLSTGLALQGHVALKPVSNFGIGFSVFYDVSFLGRLFGFTLLFHSSS